MTDMASALTYPFRLARAKARRANLRVQHRREVMRGAKLAARADRTPIFIVGAPRSGTTLIYQLLVEGLDVGWLSNAHMAAPGAVATIERRDRPRNARRTSDWESSHGNTKEAWEPNEAGEFWYRVFPKRTAGGHDQVDEWDATHGRGHDLRAMVREFMDACGQSVVFKNVLNTLRIPILAEALPEARFILIERDLADNARSLLVGRVKRGDIGAWWSAMPDDTALEPRIRDRSPAEQVVWQVQQMNHVAGAELDALHPDRSLRLSYDELCADPRGLLARVHAWLVDGGSKVALRAGANLPDSFDRRGGGALPPELEAELDVAVASALVEEDAL
jgi:hypothetical protein